jgi:hypothetical protein
LETAGLRVFREWRETECGTIAARRDSIEQARRLRLTAASLAVALGTALAGLPQHFEQVLLHRRELRALNHQAEILAAG